VNPDHLKLGTHKDNMFDMAKKKRAKHPDQKGENHSQVKLNNDQIKEIRKSCGTNLEIARKYGVSDSLVCQIKKRKCWNHVY
jgi:DNA invertase Pin-like site-specific DNA recombinase